MSETLALARLCCQRSRRLLIVTAVTFCVLQIMLLSGGASNDPNGSLVAIYLIGMIPIALLSVVLFDSGSSANLTICTSGYDPWLIRSPIPSWKLAVVPIALKTAWLLVIWIVSAFVLCHVLERPLVSMLPAITFSAAAAWLCYISWRPFSGLWTRLFLGAAIMLFSYVVMIWVFAITFELDEIKLDRHLMQYGGLAVSVVSLAAGVWFSIRAIKLARQSYGGVIPESDRRGILDALPTFGRSTSIQLNGLPEITRGAAQTSRTLVAIEFWKTSGQFSKVLLLGWIPIILVFVIAVPFHSVTAMFVIVFAACTAALANPYRPYCDSNEFRQLAPWVVASPISSANLAWSRLWGSVLNWAIMLLPLLMIYLLWMLWPSNREVWFRFVSWSAERYGSESAGHGLAGAVGLTCVVIFLTFPMRGAWVDMSGRSWLAVLFAIVVGLMPVVAIGIVSRFIWRQKTWDAARNEALQYLEYLPTVAAVLLGMKLLAVAIVAVKLRQERLATTGVIAKFIVGWAAIVAVCAIVSTLGIQEEFATPLFCLVTFALIVPLTSVLVAPIALARNRHR